jgi:hypothetical protein
MHNTVHQLMHNTVHKLAVFFCIDHMHGMNNIKNVREMLQLRYRNPSNPFLKAVCCYTNDSCHLPTIPLV